MEQKIIQIGNSAGITIPKQLLEEMDLTLDTPVIIERDQDNSLVIYKKGDQPSKNVSSKFADLLERVNKQYGPALKKLATR